MMVCTDTGTHFCFPTLGTTPPTKSDIITDCLLSSSPEFDQRMTDHNNTIWAQLRNHYNINPFLGTKKYPSSYFPEVTNEAGVTLINLAFTLYLTEKYHLGFYYLPHQSPTAIRITKLSDYFPYLQEKN